MSEDKAIEERLEGVSKEDGGEDKNNGRRKSLRVGGPRKSTTTIPFLQGKRKTLTEMPGASQEEGEGKVTADSNNNVEETKDETLIQDTETNTSIHGGDSDRQEQSPHNEETDVILSDVIAPEVKESSGDEIEREEPEKQTEQVAEAQCLPAPDINLLLKGANQSPRKQGSEVGLSISISAANEIEGDINQLKVPENESSSQKNNQDAQTLMPPTRMVMTPSFGRKVPKEFPKDQINTETAEPSNELLVEAPIPDESSHALLQQKRSSDIELNLSHHDVAEVKVMSAEECVRTLQVDPIEAESLNHLSPPKVLQKIEIEETSSLDTSNQEILLKEGEGEEKQLTQEGEVSFDGPKIDNEAHFMENEPENLHHKGMASVLEAVDTNILANEAENQHKSEDEASTLKSIDKNERMASVISDTHSDHSFQDKENAHSRKGSPQKLNSNSVGKEQNQIETLFERNPHEILNRVPMIIDNAHFTDDDDEKFLEIERSVNEQHLLEEVNQTVESFGEPERARNNDRDIVTTEPENSSKQWPTGAFTERASKLENTFSSRSQTIENFEAYEERSPKKSVSIERTSVRSEKKSYLAEKITRARQPSGIFQKYLETKNLARKTLQQYESQPQQTKQAQRSLSPTQKFKSSSEAIKNRRIAAEKKKYKPSSLAESAMLSARLQQLQQKKTSGLQKNQLDTSIDSHNDSLIAQNSHRKALNRSKTQPKIRQLNKSVERYEYDYENLKTEEEQLSTTLREYLKDPNESHLDNNLNVSRNRDTSTKDSNKTKGKLMTKEQFDEHYHKMLLLDQKKRERLEEMRKQKENAERELLSKPKAIPTHSKTKTEKFEPFHKRMNDYLKQRSEKLQELKKRTEEEKASKEKAELTFTPKINKNAKTQNSTSSASGVLRHQTPDRYSNSTSRHSKADSQLSIQHSILMNYSVIARETSTKHERYLSTSMSKDHQLMETEESPRSRLIHPQPMEKYDDTHNFQQPSTCIDLNMLGANYMSHHGNDSNSRKNSKTALSKSHSSAALKKTRIVQDVKHGPEEYTPTEWKDSIKRDNSKSKNTSLNSSRQQIPSEKSSDYQEVMRKLAQMKKEHGQGQNPTSTSEEQTNNKKEQMCRPGTATGLRDTSFEKSNRSSHLTQRTLSRERTSQHQRQHSNNIPKTGGDSSSYVLTTQGGDNSYISKLDLSVAEQSLQLDGLDQSIKKMKCDKIIQEFLQEQAKKKFVAEKKRAPKPRVWK